MLKTHIILINPDWSCQTFFSWDSYVFQFQTYRWVPFIQIIDLLISWFPSTIFSLRAKFKSPFSPMWWSEQIKNKYTRTTTTRANVVERHNYWRRTNWLLCRFKGGKPLIAFRVSGSTNLTISYESLKRQMVLLVLQLVCVCVFVPERGKGERVQCRNQLLAELFMGRCFGPSNLRKPLLKARLAKKMGYLFKTIYLRNHCKPYSSKGDTRQT